MGNKVHSILFKMFAQPSLVIVILGSTGTGKSKLAIELAKKFKGEIISADSMQVYRGLDIVTNKVTKEEQKLASHHLINCVDPLHRFTVVDFRNQALPIIERLHKEKKIPIIVGGTNYYIESLLWEVLIQPMVPEGKLLFDSDSDDESKLYDKDYNYQNVGNVSINNLLKQKITQQSMNKVPSMLLHQALKEIDPVTADSIHPKDKRKVIRSLQVYQQHGQRHSELLQTQRNQDGGSALGGPLRFKNSVMLWLQCDKPVLNQRLDDRVEEMLKRGLMKELLDFHKMYNEQRLHDKTTPYQEGIFQSIGFKEFHEYLVLPDDDKRNKEGKKILGKAIDDMKVATRQYARKQNKWVINRFLRQPKRDLPPVYSLDATAVDNWNINVLHPTIDIIQSLLENKIPSINSLPIQEEIDDVPETHYCEICERIFVGRRTWEIHLFSKKHSKRKASLKKHKIEESLP